MQLKFTPGSDIWWPRAELGHLQMTCTEENELIFSHEGVHIFRGSGHTAQVYPQ